MTRTPQASLFEGTSERPARPDGRLPETAISVTALNEATRRMLEDRVPQLWIRGEIAKWTVSGAGHRYFSLRDDGARVDCVLFRGDAWRLPADPEDGMDVAVLAQPTVYPAQGRFQLVVRSIETAGEGLWRLAFEKLRGVLEGEGLLAPERKRRLPPYPRRIGVVTSTDSAALHDVRTVLRRRSPWVRILVRHCRVQGESAAFDVRDALERLARWRDADGRGVDTIIVTRGGGSTEDLWCFNEEVAVRAVAECPVPTVCAIGHEIDVTLSELVADVRAPTPSAAAELASPDARELRSAMDVLGRGLARGLRRGVSRGRDRVRSVERQLPLIVRHRLDRTRAALDAAGQGLEHGVERHVQSGQHRVGRVAAQLDALSPLKTLGRGYAVATAPEGGLLSRANQFEPGSRFDLRVADGRVEATTDRVEVEE